MTRIVSIISVVALFLMTFCFAFAGYVICPKCGWENEDTSPVCSHCENPLPVAEDTRKEEVPLHKSEMERSIDRDTESGIISKEVENNYRRGKKKYLDQNKFMALLFFKNAMAINILDQTEGAFRKAKELLEVVESTQTKIFTTNVDCPVCRGTGKRQMGGFTLSGGIKGVDVSISCDYCSGDGRVNGFISADEIKYIHGKALIDFERLQRSRKLEKIGNVWVLPEIEKNLSLSEKVALKRAWPPSCDECAGLGRVQCGECHGAGMVECPESKCENGYIMDKKNELNKNLGSKLSGRIKCPVCDGLGVIKCSDCKGHGSVGCSECRGTGMKPVCRKCDGSGLTECSRCDGSGLYNGEECSRCNGEGVVECSSCHGYGRK